MYKRILVATDGSPNARDAVEAAAELAAAGGAEEVTLIHVVMDPRSLLAAEMDPGYWTSLHKTMHDEGERLLEEARALVARIWNGEVKTHLSVGNAAAQVRRFAEKGAYDLLVVGSRGLGALEGLLLGSVSSRLVQRPPCSILVVKGT